MKATLIAMLLGLIGGIIMILRRSTKSAKTSDTDRPLLPDTLAYTPSIEYEPKLDAIIDTIPSTDISPVTIIKPVVMASFEVAYQLVARAEGGYQKFANDPGNYNSRKQLVGTNWGISAPIYETFLGRPPSEKDMRDMSRSTAKAIYKRNFWDSIQGDRIPDQQLANILFDGRVNHGYWGVKIMQRVLGVTVDGGVGSQTLSAIIAADPKQLFNAYKQARINFYHDLANRNPEMRARWLPVWLRRINHFVYHGPSTATGSNSTLANNHSNNGQNQTAAIALAALSYFLFS